MNEIKKTTLKDRIKNAVRAFKGKPVTSVQFGIDVKRCDKCEYKIGDLIRDNLLVTAGARAGYMDSMGVINIPEGLDAEDDLAYYLIDSVDYYYNELIDVNFDEYIEDELNKKYGSQNE